MKTLHFTLVIALLGSLPCNLSAADAEPAVADTSFVQPNGHRVLQQSIVVPASVDDVWHAFTSADGLMSWAVPFAEVDFRLDGYWETSYQPGATPGDPANIRSRIISYLPLRMLSLKAEQAPPDFPNPELLDGLFSVFQFEVMAENRVRVTVSGVGYGPGDAFDNLYAMFRDANEWTLLRLHERFDKGPVQWDSVYPKITNKE